jgi:TIGR00252 family protein
MDSRHLALGEAGEEMAARHLERLGLKIVERRVRSRRGELDIVARDGREWVFVEVKTRSGDRMGTAAEAMTRRKIGRMFRAVREYVAAHGLENEPIRLDLVAIDFNGEGVPVIAHYPGGIGPA